MTALINEIAITIIVIIIFFAIKKISDHYFFNFLKVVDDKNRVTLLHWIYRAIWIFLFIFTLFIILQQWGVEIMPLLTGLGILSLIIGLALQNTLSNLFSGISLTADQSIRIGDIIEIPEKGIRGIIEGINWRSVKIRTFENNIIYIPNSVLANSIFINYSQPMDFINVWFEVGVSYFEDLSKVEEVTIKVAKNVQKSEWGDPMWEPKVFFHKFGDSNIHLYVVLRARNFLTVKYLVHEFIKELKKAYDEEGIEISFPNVNVFLRKGKENYKLDLS